MSRLLAIVTGVEAAPRTFVASNGLDTNPCRRIAPCRSFGSAVTQTDSGGEVIVLDSARYGPVTIAKPVSIIAPPGVYAGISVPPGQEGVIIDHPTARVVLRGLTINGVGAGAMSIRISVVRNVIAQGGIGATVRGVASTNAFMLADGNDISRNITNGLDVENVRATLVATGNTLRATATGSRSRRHPANPATTRLPTTL